MTTIQERQQADQDDSDRFARPSVIRREADPTVLYLTAEIAKREDALGILDDEITRLHASLAERDATIERMSKVAADAFDLLTKERDEARAMIATDDTELQAKDATIAERDASIARLTIRLAKDDRDATIERLTYDRNHPYGEIGAPCPESCGGQSWTGVDQAEGPGKVWRCDTCGRIVGQHVSNPMQAADDRRAL